MAIMPASWRVIELNFKSCKASVVELVDTLDSKSGFFGSSGSSPLTGTTSFLEVKKSTLVGFFYVWDL